MAKQLPESDVLKEMKTKSGETKDATEDKLDESVETGYGSVSQSSESAAIATASSESVTWTSEEHDLQQVKSEGITTRSQKKAKELMAKGSEAKESKLKPKLPDRSRQSPVKQFVDNLGKRLTSISHYRRLGSASSVDSQTSQPDTTKSPDKLKSPKAKTGQPKVKSPRKQTTASGESRSPSASPKKKTTASASKRVKSPAKGLKSTSKSPSKKNDTLPSLGSKVKGKTGEEDKTRGSPEQKKSSVGDSNPILKSLLLRGRAKSPEKEGGLPCSQPSGEEVSVTKPSKPKESPSKVASVSKTADISRKSPAKQGAAEGGRALGKGKADTQHIDTSLGTFLKDTLNINANIDDVEEQHFIDDMETCSPKSGDEDPKPEGILMEERPRTVWRPSNPNQRGGYVYHGVEGDYDSSPEIQEPPTESSKITDPMEIHDEAGAMMGSVSSDTQSQISGLEEDPVEDSGVVSESKEEFEAKRQLKRMKEVLSSDSDEDKPAFGSPVKKANLPIVDESGELE